MRWTPRFTVAAIVMQENRFLVVEEHIDGMVVFNQPAGHLEDDESLAEAVVREMREETARDFTPEALTGIYRWTHPDKGDTYIRVCFSGRAGPADPDQPLDDGILGTRWFDRATLAAQPDRLRSPLVLRCIDDHLAGARHPLSLLVDVEGR